MNPISFFGVCLLLALFATVESTFAQPHVPPPRPAVAPLIGERYANDADGDRIDDQLLDRAQQAVAAEKVATTPEQKSQARAKLDELVNVELIFNEPVTQRQMDTFTALGGEITYVYKAVSFGWNARIPLNKINAIPAAMGASLVLLNEPKGGHTQLDVATRTGRVRPVWASNFAGNPSGFTGNSNTTIAILDSGVDESHADLNGRRIFWHDYTSSAYPDPIDVNGHGTHVAGIALGSGASGGSAAGTLKFTQNHNLSSANNGGFLTDAMELPTNSVTITATAKWVGGSASGTRLHWAQRLRTAAPNSWSSVTSVVGTSPLTLTFTMTGLSDRTYSPALIQSNGITEFVVTYQISNYPGTADGFNKERGVAAGCNWAGAKVTSDTASYTSTDLSAAIDDLVANRVAQKIKVMNLSLGSGLDPATRQKVNSAANNGVVMVVAAGNRGGNLSGIGTGQVSDPGRAKMALTVAAASSLNQLTEYSREGFASPDSTSNQEEDYKPDLMAPGGSYYHGYVTAPDSGSSDGPAFGDLQANDYKKDYGTSMATPFAAGAAALVIDALEQTGVEWDFNSSEHSRLVKMILCATASESNTNREGTGAFVAPSLQRATSLTITNGNGDLETLPRGKDLGEGFGMINPDVAVEAIALSYTNGVVETDTLGSATTDRRGWARAVNLFAGRNFTFTLTNPVSGDFDLYLYSATPSSKGTPELLAWSTQAGNGTNETLNFTAGSDQKAIVVVKRISGSGTFNLLGNAAPAVDFVADITNGLAPLTVNFSNLTTGASSNFWEFGDGNTSTSKDTSNTYTNAGTYTVTLTAVGPGGSNSLTKTGLIVVTNLPPPLPAAMFAATPINGIVPLGVTFTNQSTDATNYVWSFGDGATSTDAQPLHTYTNAGAFSVTLQAFGPGGTNEFTRDNYILVLPEPMLLSPTARGDEFTFSFETVPGKSYGIEWKDDLNDPEWTLSPDTIVGDGTVKTFTNSISIVPQRFFRLKILDGL